MNKFVSLFALAAISVALGASPNAYAANGACNNPATVGGGTLAVSPSSGAGWDVGTGQCNGDFTVFSDSSFPSSVAGDGLELGMRAEQRRIGPVNPPNRNGNDYKVETGEDPGTGGTRAWWNFQQSIAYDGNINDLDALVFAIRTDAGTSVPAGPVDMLAIRGIIDDRNDNSGTATYTDLYQTSQNPLFGWLSNATLTGPYDINEEGAWYLTLAALEDGVLADVGICIHTPNAACNPVAPVAYTCTAFEAPIPSDGAIALKKKQNRVLPLKMVCTDSSGNVLTEGDISSPVIDVQFFEGANPPVDASSEILAAGKGTDGNEFVATDGGWSFNLQTKPFSASGTYVVSVKASGGDVLVGSPTAMFTRP